MKNFQRNLFIVLAIGLCGACVWQWYLQSVQINTIERLDQVLSNRFRADTNLPVYISGDAATLHGSMVDVLEAVRRAGVQKVAFMVDGSTNIASP